MSSAPADLKIRPLNQVWKSYNEQVELLTIYAAGMETDGSLVQHIDLVKIKMKTLQSNPLVFRDEFAKFTETQMDVLAAAQVANECALEIIKELHAAFEASNKSGQLKTFPFTIQEKKLTVLMAKVDEQCKVLEEALLQAFQQEELAGKIEKKQAPPLENKKIS